MNDSQRPNSREVTLKHFPRHEKLPTPLLAHVASPSPAKARRRPGTERPALSTADLGPVKLPSELFAIATSRNSQGDMALSKALDGIQAAATHLETERTKLVIQSQELQIWDMAREEELVLLRAENEQLEQQLVGIGDKVSKGLGRDGVLDSLQFALRKARSERDAEVREADTLFNQLQEAKAAAQELQDLRAAFNAALSNLGDEWSVAPLLAEEARQLRARADAAAQDPTNLGQEDMSTLLRGLSSLASRGTELQREVQTLRGEKAALQQALDSAHQQMAQQELQAETAQISRPSKRSSALDRLGQPRAAGSGATQAWPPVQVQAYDHQQQQHDEVVLALQGQVSGLQGKLAEYRSFLLDNQEEIEALQGELKRLRQTQQQVDQALAAPSHPSHAAAHAPRGHKQAAPSGRGSHSGARAVPAPSAVAAAASNSTASGVVTAAHASDSNLRRQQDNQQQKSVHGAQHPLHAVGTPTRHMPSSSSPISTVNYGASPQAAVSPSARGSPISHQAAADIAQKVAELQELALRAQQQAAKRESDIVQQHEQQLEELRRELAQQNAAELAALSAQLAQAQAREAELARQNSRLLADLEGEAAKLTAQHTHALAELHGQMSRLKAQHSQALAERDGQAVQELLEQFQDREAELQRLHAEALARLEVEAEAQLAVALAEQAARLEQVHAQAQRDLEEHMAQLHAQRQEELEERLAQHYVEQQARRDEEARNRHAERLAEQAMQLARLHAEQAAALGMQQVEAVSDRETQLLLQFEQQLMERESQLANAQADQMRDLEERSQAQIAAAAEEREAQLRQSFEEQLAQALREQQKLLAAEAEARLAERAAAEAEEARLAQRLAEQQYEDDFSRREDELVRQLDEQCRRAEELERQLIEAQTAAAASAAAATMAAANAQEAQDALVADATRGAAAAAEAEVRQLGRQLADRDEQLADRDEQLAQRGEQLAQLADRGEELAQLAQRHAQEVEAALEEGERRREEAVAEMERQCVEVVARLGREHEKASAEARVVHELREANLRRALERQAQEAQETERRQGERLTELQKQLADLQSLLAKERQQHAASSEALQRRLEQLASELEVARQRDAELQREEREAVRQGRNLVALGRPHPSEVEYDPANNARASLSASPAALRGLQQLGQAAGQPEAANNAVDTPTPIGTPSTASCPSEAAGPDADIWHDGKALLWPDHAAPSGSRPSSTDSAVVAAADMAGRDEQTAAHAALVATLIPSSAGQQAGWASAQLPSQGREEPVRRSGQDLAANLLRVLRVLESEGGSSGGSAVGARLWTSSLELSDKKAPRQGLLQGDRSDAAAAHPDAMAPMGLVVELSATAAFEEAGRSEEPEEGAEQGRVRLRRARSTVSRAGSLKRPAHELVVTAATQEGAEAAQTSTSAPPTSPWPAGAAGAEDQEWGELMSAPVAAAVNAQRGFGSASMGRGYISEAATSVSTTSSYNSDTEFYVDDEDDDDLRGRALAAALATSPRASQDLPAVAVPPLLLELQERRRTQSAGPSSPAGSTQNSPSGARSQDAVGASGTSAGDGAAKPCPLAEGAAGLWPDGPGGPDQHGGSDELEVTLSDPFPILDPQLLAAERRHVDLVSVTVVAPAGSDVVVDLEATLSGPFPVLLPPPPPHDLPSPGLAADPQAASRPASLSPPPPFTFSGQQQGADVSPADLLLPYPTSGCVESRGLSSRAAGDLRRRSMDLSASFDFSGTGRPWVPDVAASERPADPSGGDADVAASERPADPSGGDADVRGDGGGSRQAYGAADEIEDFNGRGEGDRVGNRVGGRRGSEGGSSTSSMSSPTHVYGPTVHDGDRDAWAVPFDDSTGSADADEKHPATAAEAPLQGQSELWFAEDISIEPARQYGACEIGSPESEAEDGGFGARRTAPMAGVVPLMTPNPLYDETGEASASPPWSIADWSATDESVFDAPEEGTSLPSTPGSETSASHGPTSGSSASGSRRGSSGGSGPDGSADEPLLLDPPPPGVSVVEAVRSDRCRARAKRRAGVMRWEDTVGGGSNVGGGVEVGGGRWGSGVEAGRGVQDGVWFVPAAQLGEASRAGGEDAEAAWQEAQRQQRRPGGDDGQSPRISSVRSRGENSSAEQQVSGEGQDEMAAAACGAEEEDDTRSLLAAGATLGSSERRRRQRRRMGDAPVLPPVGHPLDLLRQSWEFVRGVATPLSPRTAMHHGRVQGHALGHSSPRFSAAAIREQGVLAPLPSEPQQQQQAEEEREQEERDSVWPPQQQLPGERGSSSSSPIGARHPDGSGVLDFAASWNSTPTKGTVSQARGSPRTPGQALALIADQQDATPAIAGAPAGPLVVVSPAADASAPGLPMSPYEAKQRSRTVLGRARSRVAELEDQCRALAASLDPPAVAIDGPGSPSPAPYNAENQVRTPGWQQQLISGPGGGESPTTAPGSDGGFGALEASGDSGGGDALLLSPPQRPAAPADVIDALDDLRGDLFELEKLHHLTVQGTLTPPPQTEGLLLGGMASGSVGDGAEPTGIPATGPQQAGHRQEEMASSAPPEPRAAGGMPHGMGDGTVSPLPARNPASGSPSAALDPALVSLLQLSIQAQLHGQLGQLQAKIAELQRHNEALLYAASAASTPATPLPPHLQGGFISAIAVTPIPMTPLTAHTHADSSAARAPSEASSGSADGAAAPWAAFDGLWAQAGLAGSDSGGGVGSFGPALLPHAAPPLPSPQTTVTPAWHSAPITAFSATPPGHTSMSVYPGTALMQSVAATTMATSGQAGGGISGSGGTVASPYSPEQLAQLHPAVQLFAPPQLRAAAVAAAHEQNQHQRRLT